MVLEILYGYEIYKNKVDIVPPYVVECVSASAQLDSPTEDEPHIEM